MRFTPKKAGMTDSFLWIVTIIFFALCRMDVLQEVGGFIVFRRE
jgi:hypothetical protein